MKTVLRKPVEKALYHLTLGNYGHATNWLLKALHLTIAVRSQDQRYTWKVDKLKKKK